MELGPQLRVDAVTCLVPVVELIAEGLDDVICGDSNVCGSVVDHLKNRVENTDDSSVGDVAALGETFAAVELAEEFVCAVDDVDVQTNANTLNGLPLPSTIFNGAAITTAPVAGS